MKQKNLFEYSQKQYAPELRGEKEFGGSKLKGKRKWKRPLNTKDPLHLILKGDIIRSGSLVWNSTEINALIETFALRFKVKIFEKAIVSNHIHFVLKVPSREAYANFVRAVAGTIAKKFKIKWDFRPYTRILSWGRQFQNAIRYAIKNHLEAIGKIAYSPRHRSKPTSTRKREQLV